VANLVADPVAVHLPTDVLQAVDDIAAAADRSTSWVILRALRLYLVSEGADILAIAGARREIAAGGGVNLDDVNAEVERLIGPNSQAA